MRCICCDADKTTWWRDNYYCSPCLNAIKGIIREDKYAEQDRKREREANSDSSNLRKMQPQGVPNGMGRQKLLSLLWAYDKEGKGKDGI